MNVIYRQPAGKIKPFKNFLKELFNKNKHSNRAMYIAGDFNLNVLDHSTNKKVKNFLNLLFQNNLIPLINKPTRITRHTETAIDHIITNTFLDTKLITGVIRTSITDHLPIFLISEKTKVTTHSEKKTILKRLINE